MPREINLQQDTGNNAIVSTPPSESPPSEPPPSEPSPSDRPNLPATNGDADSSAPPNIKPEKPVAGDSGQGVDSVPDEANSVPDEANSVPDEANSAPDEADSRSVFPYSFTAVDLYGNTVTERTLGEKKVFFIHYWGTWCPPCINEMPDLAKVAQEYADRVGFIGLLDDYDSNLSGAINIAESSGIPNSFIMIDANLPGVRPMLELVQTGYVPTTVLLSMGDAYGPLIGAYGEGYAEYLDILLEG